MQNDRRGGGRPPRRDPRAGGSRGDYSRPRRDAGDRQGDFRPRQEGDFRPRQEGDFRPRPRSAPREGGYTRSQGSREDDGGMSIRLDPRRFSTLKQLAGEASMRPGELVQLWIEERLDAERRGGASTQPSTAAFDELTRRLNELSRRVDELATRSPAAQATKPGAVTESAAPSVPLASSEPKRGATNGRRRPATSVSAQPAVKRVPLHEEIAAVISKDGPMSAADLARAISKRGRYAAPRSDRPLDAATVNSRVSNPVYRSRFRREDGKIGLA